MNNLALRAVQANRDISVTDTLNLLHDTQNGKGQDVKKYRINLQL